MPDFTNLYRAAAIASLLSAITTATLIYGPNAATAEGIEAQAHLSSNWLYLYKPWVLFFHPQFSFVAALGAAAALFAKRPARVVIGIFYLALWAMTEMTQQAFIIDALNQFWRPGLLSAEGVDQRQTYTTLITGFAAISDSQYFVLLFGFGAGSVFLGWAFLARGGLGRAIGIVTVALGVVSLCAFAGYYFGPAAAVTSVTGWIYANLYGPVQTGVRVALAVWLWREASRAALERAALPPS